MAPSFEPTRRTGGASRASGDRRDRLTAIRTRTSSTSASTTSRLRRGGRRRNLRSRLILHLDEAACGELLHERDDVALAAIRLDVVLRSDRVADLANRARLLDELPDPRPDRVEPVVDTVFEVQEHGLVLELGGGDLRGRGDPRGAVDLGGAHALRPSSSTMCTTSGSRSSVRGRTRR